MWLIGVKGRPALCFQMYWLCSVWSFEEMFGGALGFCLDFFQNSFLIYAVQDLQWTLMVSRPGWQARLFLQLLNSLETFRFIPPTLLCNTSNTKPLSFLPHVVYFDTWDYLWVLLYFLLDVAVLPGIFFLTNIQRFRGKLRKMTELFDCKMKTTHQHHSALQGSVVDIYTQSVCRQGN